MTPGIAPADGDLYPEIFYNMFKLLTDVEGDCLESPYHLLSSAVPEPRQRADCGQARPPSSYLLPGTAVKQLFDQFRNRDLALELFWPVPNLAMILV